jgi:hypothetical protein
MSLRPERSLLKSPSAIGLRQTLPVQINKTSFMNGSLKMVASDEQVNCMAQGLNFSAFAGGPHRSEDRLHKTLVKRF